MKRAALALFAAVAVALTGCTTPRSGSLGPAPTGAVPLDGPPAGAVPSGSPAGPVPNRSPTGAEAGGGPVGAAPNPTPTDGPPPGGRSGSDGTVTITLWFVRGGRLAPTRVTRPATVATSRLALAELLAGPAAGPARAGLTSGIPPGVRFEIVGIRERVETVSFGPTFYAGPPQLARLRQAQVVYTLTQFTSVTRVAFRAGGAPPPGPPDRPVDRQDYADLLPAIVVTSPDLGQRVSSPITVTGTADVFEATVNVRVLDGAGREIATAFATASCGTGCRGEYRVTVPYRLPAGQPGSVEVYELSARDGSRVNVVTIPVTLS